MTSADDAVPEAGRPPVPVPGSAPVFRGFPPIHPGYPPALVPPRPYRPAPVPLAPDGRPLADFGTRLLAYLIDGTLLSAISMVIFVPIFVVVFLNAIDFTAPEPPEPTALLDDLVGPVLITELALIAFMLAGYYVYYVEMMYRSGQTLGKKLLKIKVVPIEPGATMTRGRAARRYLVEMVAGVFVPLFSYLDGLWQLWDKPYQQTLHDKAAQTVVIKVAP